MQATTNISTPVTVPDLNAFLLAIRSLARDEGVTLTPLPGVWVIKICRSTPYHRGRNAGMSLAVAASGRKSVSIGKDRLVNDASRFMVLHGERSYEAEVEASMEVPYIALKLQLPPELVAKTLIEFAETGYSASDEALSSELPVFCDKLTADLAAPLLRLIRSFDDPADCRMLAPSCLREICYRLLRSDAAGMLGTSITREDTKLITAMRFIEGNAGRSLSVADIASEVAMSPSHFAHRFRTCFGVSPMRYRKQVRLEKARLLLLNETATVSMAASGAGYASDAHFTRDFKQLFGLSPRAYTRNMHTQFALDNKS
jgi:AraC-like DNA-binding protein